MMSEIQKKILQLKKEKDAIILAHYYQEESIQEIADFVGDSLELSRAAAETMSDIIVFCGVHFMAETAKLLNPNKKVLLPDINAGCSLADNCKAEDLLKWKNKHPNHVLVTYINCSAEVKAISDYVCTSSNAKKIINAIPIEQPILFAPDKNLGLYLQNELKRPLVLWEGSCVVHEAFSFQKIVELKKENPNAHIIAHPESEQHILKIAKFIGSTSQLINYILEHPKDCFIIATEAGILHKIKKLAPKAKLFPAPALEDNSCACSECAYMKVNNLEKLLSCLEKESPEIKLDSSILEKAKLPILKMLALS